MTHSSLEYGDSPIHKLDPKIRILVAFFLSFAGALSNEIYIILGYLCLGILFNIFAHLEFDQVAARLKPLFWFLLMIWLFLPLTFTQEILFDFGWIKISQQGILLSAKITLKSIAILLIFTVLITTMPVASLGRGLHQLKVPDKLVFLLLMTYRYIAVIQEEYQRLLRAARFRGFKPGTNLHSYKTFAYLAGMLFVRASFRARRVYQAMLCRGFDQKFHTLDVHAPYGLNSVFFFAMIVAGSILIFIERL
ncbi:MAG: cobalt ECF transporter T component CbiQ [Desulfobacter sp.]|nr:cobalt ECF transporter T component CbiQ [Desulfobacter sp.]WDP86557.1 MAG: cobalt ECF transporter T component CbiQ [Desulfobacter sp.]